MIISIYQLMGIINNCELELQSKLCVYQKTLLYSSYMLIQEVFFANNRLYILFSYESSCNHLWLYLNILNLISTVIVRFIFSLVFIFIFYFMVSIEKSLEPNIVS